MVDDKLPVNSVVFVVFDPSCGHEILSVPYVCVVSRKVKLLAPLLECVVTNAGMEAILFCSRH